MTAQERITEWAELADNATAGPWVDMKMGSEGSTVHASPHGESPTIRNTRRIGRIHEFENAAHIAASRTAVPAMAAALTAVLERHRPIEVEPSDTICSDCSFRLPNGRFFGKIVEWPCPTVAAIETALEES